jgi:hypothetical protein
VAQEDVLGLEVAVDDVHLPYMHTHTPVEEE